MRYDLKKIGCMILAAALLLGSVTAPCAAAKKKTDCKTLCAAALKVTGGSQKLKYSSVSAMDFGALSSSARNKVKSMQYVFDAKEVYSLCVMEAKNSAAAKSLLQTLQKYKKRNSGSDYLSDYSSEEQKVFQNAVCAKKKNYVWYIAMSPDKKKNSKGQKALTKKI